MKSNNTPSLEFLGSDKSTLKDFIRFFESKPAKTWCVDELKNNKGQRCAVGHLKVLEKNWMPYDRLRSLGVVCIISVNNGEGLPNRQKGIKTRVLNYLRSLGNPK